MFVIAAYLRVDVARRLSDEALVTIFEETRINLGSTWNQNRQKTLVVGLLGRLAREDGGGG
jgi:hypothetical protein